jgi:hypothetical protein
MFTPKVRKPPYAAKLAKYRTKRGNVSMALAVRLDRPERRSGARLCGVAKVPQRGARTTSLKGLFAAPNMKEGERSISGESLSP